MDLCRRACLKIPTILVLLTTNQTGCAQQASVTRLEDRLARRIAEDEVIAALLTSGGRFPFFVDEPKAWTWDTRLALGLVSASSPEALISKVDNLKLKLRMANGILANVFENTTHVDNTFQVASNAASSTLEMGGRWSEFQESRELERNEKLVTVDQAIRIIEVANQLRETEGLDATLTRMTGKLRSAIDRNRPALVPFQKDVPVSERLKKSRDRVKALLDVARKALARHTQ